MFVVRLAAAASISSRTVLNACMCVCVCLQQDRIQANNGVLTISSLNLADIAMYQCVAENKHGRVFTNAELRVVGKTKHAALKIHLLELCSFHLPNHM